MFFIFCFLGVWSLRVNSKKWDNMLVLAFVGQTRFVPTHSVFKNLCLLIFIEWPLVSEWAVHVVTLNLIILGWVFRVFSLRYFITLRRPVSH